MSTISAFITAHVFGVAVCAAALDADPHSSYYLSQGHGSYYVDHRNYDSWVLNSNDDRTHGYEKKPHGYGFHKYIVSKWTNSLVW